MPQIFSIMDVGGRTLLTKAQGDIPMPSFPTVGLLCSISTFGDSSGFTIETFNTQNVCIVYKRFKNDLLFVLATSNKLVQPDLLQVLMQVVYDGVVMMLGIAAMTMDSAHKLDVMRKKLRGLTLIESLIADDSLVPCLMMPVPQLLGLPLRDRAVLHASLEKVASAAGTAYAALVTEGYYVAATAEWWMLTPREALLLQHMATNAPETTDIDMEVFLSVKRWSQPLRLLVLKLDQGVHLLMLCNPSLDPVALQPVIEEQMPRVRPVLEVPIWARPPVPQFGAIGFELALVWQRSPSACATLFWGHSTVTPQGFNPLMSPTLRRQLLTSAGGTSSATSGGGSTSRSASVREAHVLGSLQLYYKSCVDTLISFVLQCQGQAVDLHTQRRSLWPVTQTEAQAGPSQGVSSPGPAPALAGLRQGSGRNAGWEAPGTPSAAQRIMSFLSKGRSPSSAAPGGTAQPQGDEVQLATASHRMVALTDPAPNGVVIYVLFDNKVSRIQAQESAAKLRAIYCMSYAAGGD